MAPTRRLPSSAGSRYLRELDFETIQQIAFFQNTAKSLGFTRDIDTLVLMPCVRRWQHLSTRVMLSSSSAWNVYASSDYRVHCSQVQVLAREADDGSSASETTYLFAYKLEGTEIADVMVGSMFKSDWQLESNCIPKRL